MKKRIVNKDIIVLNRSEIILKRIYTIILLLFSVEYIGWGELSVYRIGILPLSILGVVLINKHIRESSYKTILLMIVCYMLYLSVCLFSNNENYLFPILTLPLAVFFISFLALKKKIEIDYAKIFIWYSLPHVIALLLGVANYDGDRFAGLQDDPNFCGIFLGFSIISSIELVIRKNSNYYWKVLCVVFLIIDLFLLFLTGSRGSMLSLVLLSLVLFWRMSIKKIWKLFILFVLGLSLWKLYGYIDELPEWVSPDVSLVDSILCRFKPDSLAEGSHRDEIWATVWTRLIESNPFMAIGMKNAMRGLENGYPHNTFLDIMVETGLLVGLLVIVVFVYWILKSYYRVIKKEYSDKDMVFIWCCYSILLQVLFLSALEHKIFWISVFYIAYKANEKKTKRLKFNYEDFNSNPNVQG